MQKGSFSFAALFDHFPQLDLSLTLRYKTTYELALSGLGKSFSHGDMAKS